MRPRIRLNDPLNGNHLNTYHFATTLRIDCVRVAPAFHVRGVGQKMKEVRCDYMKLAFLPIRERLAAPCKRATPGFAYFLYLLSAGSLRPRAFSKDWCPHPATKNTDITRSVAERQCPVAPPVEGLSTTNPILTACPSWETSFIFCIRQFLTCAKPQGQNFILQYSFLRSSKSPKGCFQNSAFSTFY